MKPPRFKLVNSRVRFIYLSIFFSSSKLDKSVDAGKRGGDKNEEEALF